MVCSGEVESDSCRSREGDGGAGFVDFLEVEGGDEGGGGLVEVVSEGGGGGWLAKARWGFHAW